MRLAYFGDIDPRLVEINYSLPPKGPTGSEHEQSPGGGLDLGPRPGWYAVSVSLLRGRQFVIPDGNGGRAGVGKPYYSYFLKFRPESMAGYSIYIYRLSPGACEEVRRELGLPSLGESGGKE